MRPKLSLPFYSGQDARLGDLLPAVVPPKPVVVQKTLVDYLPLILAVVTLALTLYMLSQQSKKRRTQ